MKQLLEAKRTGSTEKGEGVISLAIAVLIMAVIGAAMFVTFSKISKDTGTKAETKIATID
jgi:flagellar basal body-associated protein FliL